MQVDVLSRSALEELYEKVILPQFGIIGNVVWEEHRTIGPDNEAHVFLHNKKRLVLVYDDYPTTDTQSLAAEFPYCTATRVAMDLAKGNVAVDNNASPASDDRCILRFGPNDLPFKHIHDVTGYFQLFIIERPSGAGS